MINKAFNKFLTALITLLIIFALGTGTMAYWLMWPYNPITVHSITVLNPGKTVEVGECLRYRIIWTKHTDKPGRLMRYFVNGSKHPMDDDTDGGSLCQAPIGPGEAVIKKRIEKDTPLGRGRMQWSIAYQMNPINNVRVPPAYSDYFTVTAKSVPGIKGDTGKQGVQGKQGIEGKQGIQGKAGSFFVNTPAAGKK